ncbi:hypothetical protein FSARC_9430 [Fusarium sarcochroum]|uniref:Aminoglycoside phosphotransferase domain-containing protein n=1 Tax=Fusarium sarcochroum TaxID=1208366 RepID=A0A8H4X5B2_9HYPO|nr:hypothetical protein FSARC_9430 [Fusarium sarcochroum]
MPVCEDQMHGLYWEEKTFGKEPRWSIAPHLDNIKSTLQARYPERSVEVEFITQGAFNKVYSVTIRGQQPLILRVSLPVDPRYKTLSEVATTRWLSANTTIPVPQVINYDSSRDSTIGFEWILMTKLDGTCLSDVWRRLDLSIKSDLVRKFAVFSSRLFQNQFSDIGNIYPASTSSIGRIVSMPFFWGDRICFEVERGPFRSSKDWLLARLFLAQRDCNSLLGKYPTGVGLDSDAEAEIDDATRTLTIIKKLHKIIDLVFPNHDNNQNVEEPTILCHTDLNLSNILVDDTGHLTGVVDWECVSALPLWKACFYPPFLEGRPRHEKPDSCRYAVNENGEVNELYHEHLMDYELTCLRVLFLGEMERLESGWTAVFKASQTQRDFDLAVEQCDSEFQARDIIQWADDIASGREDVRSLHEMIYGS